MAILLPTEDGDEIFIDLTNRTIDLMVDEATLSERRKTLKAFKPRFLVVGFAVTLHLPHQLITWFNDTEEEFQERKAEREASKKH